jgi:hypothetical protein
MCALGVSLLVSRRVPTTAPSLKIAEPLEFRPVRTIVPYTLVMVFVVLAYGMVSTHDAGAAVSSITNGMNRYAFADPIYAWHRWSIFYYWTARHPYRDLLSGSWWGTILVLGPLGIATWGAFAVRASRRIAPLLGDAGRSPT